MQRKPAPSTASLRSTGGTSKLRSTVRQLPSPSTSNIITQATHWTKSTPSPTRNINLNDSVEEVEELDNRVEQVEDEVNNNTNNEEENNHGEEDDVEEPRSSKTKEVFEVPSEDENEQRPSTSRDAQEEEEEEMDIHEQTALGPTIVHSQTAPDDDNHSEDLSEPSTSVPTTPVPQAPATQIRRRGPKKSPAAATPRRSSKRKNSQPNKLATKTNTEVIQSKRTKRTKRKGYQLKALREIKECQTNINKVFIPMAPFVRVVRWTVDTLFSNPRASNPREHAYRWRKDAMIALKEAAEQFCTEQLSMANFAALHCKRVTLMTKDMALVRKIQRFHSSPNASVSHN